jgi:hypothetical protein
VVTFDSSAVKLWAEHDPRIVAGTDRLAGLLVGAMKAACPVSPVQAVYAYPVPPGSSKGPVHKGRPIARPAGPDVSRSRAAGDLPLRPSGYLRSSIHAFRLPDGSVIIGPTAPYGKFVNDGTLPHEIHSHGPWPLRNRATGQVFGPVVHHPGTRAQPFIQQALDAVPGIRMELG